MIHPAAFAVAGLAVGALANVPVERLPAAILAEERERTEQEMSGPGLPGWWLPTRRVALILATGGLFALAAGRFDDDLFRAVFTSVFAAAFLALAVTDLEHQLLPDKIVLPGIAIGLVLSPFHDHLLPWDGVLGALVGFLVFIPIWGWAMLTGREGRIMGFGDVKFTAMMGAVLGLQFLGVALYLGVLLGGIAAVLLLVARLLAPRALGRTRVMPYGTFLAIGGLIALLYGRPIVDRVIDFLA